MWIQGFSFEFAAIYFLSSAAPEASRSPYTCVHASTIGEDSQKEVFISVYDLNTFTVVKTNPMQTMEYGEGESPLIWALRGKEFLSWIRKSGGGKKGKK